MGRSIPKLILVLDRKYEYTLWPTEESAGAYAKSRERILEHEELKKHQVAISPGETVLMEELKYQVPPKSIDPFWMYIRERMFEAEEDHFTFPIRIEASSVEIRPAELTVTKQPLDLKALGKRFQKEVQKKPQQENETSGEMEFL